MKRFLVFGVLAVVLLFAGTASAQTSQTVVAGATYVLTWDQGDTDAPAFQYYLIVDGVPQMPQAATCVDKSANGVTSFECSVPFPAMTPGNHTITVTATTIVDGTMFQSMTSDPLNIRLVPAPNKPGGLRITIR